MRPSISFSSRKDSNSHTQVPPASPMPTSAPPMQNGAAPESSVNQLCVSCYGLCAAVTRIVEQLPHQVIIKEDCRKSSRLLKRVEVLISDTHPYLSASPDVAGAYQDELLQALQEIKAGMVDVFNTVSLVASKGPLATYMQGDRILSSFTAAAGRLDVALGLLARAAEPHKLLPEETQEELCIVRSLLQRARFDPSPDHAAVMASFRDGVQTMQSGFGQVMGAVAKIVRSITCGSDSLSREGLQHAKDELVSEHEYITALGDPYNDSIHLRVMLDILRVHNQGPTDTPLAFICPICHQIMQDPVVLQETGHSYERKAIENWFNKGHHYCPRTGKALSRKLCVIDNPNLRDAINLWKQDSALNTSFRPVMQSLVNLKQYEAELAQLKAQHLAEAQQQAVAAAEKNAAQQAALRGSAAPEAAPSQTGSLHSRSSGSMQPSRSRDMGALHDGTPYSVVRHVHIAPTPTVYGASEPAAAQQGSSAVQGGVGEEQAGQPQQQQQQQQSQQQQQQQQEEQQEEQQEQGQEQQQQSEADQLMAPLPNQEQLQQAQDLQSPALSESSMTQKSHVAIPELGGAGVGSPHSSTARAVLFSTSAHARSHGAQGPPSQASQASQEEGEKSAFKPARLQADHLPPSSTMDAAMNAAMCSPFAPPPSVGSSTAYMGSRVDEDVLQMDPNQAAPSVCGSEAVPPPPASEDGMSLQGLRVSGTGDAASVYAPSVSATATDGPLGRTASSLAGDGASLGGGGSVVGDPAWGAPDAGGGSIAGSAAGDAPQGGDSGNHVQEGVELKGA